MNSDKLSQAFDECAPTYLSEWGTDPAAQHQRRQVHRVLHRVFPAGAHVLDLGCGPGVDASALACWQYRVTAVDLSAGMLDVAAHTTAGQGVELLQVDLSRPDTLPPGPFAGTYSNFGVLNCLDLPPLAQALASRLEPDSRAVWVVMSRHCPAECLSLTLQGHPREAWRRRRRAIAPVGDNEVPVHYLDARDIETAFGPWFVLEEVTALGVVLPPPGRAGARFHWMIPPLKHLERRVSQWPVLRSWGDHTLVVLRRTHVRAQR